MTAPQTILPEGWKRPPGYSQAVKSAPVNLTVAGQFGWDPQKQKCVDGGFGAQWTQALRNLRTVVEAAGGTVADIVGLRIFVLSMAEYQGLLAEVGAGWSDTLGRHFPAITLVQVAAFTDPDALVEIEATASVPPGDGV